MCPFCFTAQSITFSFFQEREEAQRDVAQRIKKNPTLLPFFPTLSQEPVQHELLAC